MGSGEALLGSERFMGSASCLFVFKCADAWGEYPPCNPPQSVEIASPAVTYWR
jgi:hypothetical protein